MNLQLTAAINLIIFLYKTIWIVLKAVERHYHDTKTGYNLWRKIKNLQVISTMSPFIYDAILLKKKLRAD
jgi:hypothetical protein